MAHYAGEILGEKAWFGTLEDRSEGAVLFGDRLCLELTGIVDQDEFEEATGLLLTVPEIVRPLTQ